MNYDFTNLTDYEFQELAADIVSVRDNIKLYCNKKGPDGKIDFYDLNDTIIGQAKKYKDNFSILKNKLKDDIEFAKKSINKRYILVTSVTCDKKNRETLLELFDGAIKKEDIIDRKDLNNLLSDKKYHKLLLKYIKLSIPNSYVLKKYLNEVVHNNIYTQTASEREKINKARKVFAINKTYYEAFNKLDKDKTIIITGEPGVGKTILGRMLTSYYVEDDVQFFSVKKINELYQVYSKDVSQVYFFDDFWGDINYNFKISSEEHKLLIDFINLIKNDNNKYLIITTREYILNEGINQNKLIIKNIDKYKYNLNVDAFTELDRFDILYNHIIKTNLSWEHLNIILRLYKNIINHPNYTPRFIETFFENYNSNKSLDDYEFYRNLINYLDEPYDYWDSIISKQSFEMILLLILIALNDQEIEVKKLTERYNNIISKHHLEREVNVNIEELLKTMDDTFTIMNIKEDYLYIKLKNSSFRDYILLYLSKNITLYIRYIYDEQLNIEESILIWLSIYKNIDIYKSIEEVKYIDELLINKLEHVDKSKYYSYLLELSDGMTLDKNTRIETYIIDKIIELLVNIDNLGYSDYHGYEALFKLIKINYQKYDFSKYIYNVMDSVIFTSDSFYEIENIALLKNCYEDIYKSFYNEYKDGIRENLIRCALNTAYDIEDDENSDALYFLRYEIMTEVYNTLGIKIPKKLDVRINEIDERLMNKISSKEITEDYFSSNSDYLHKENKNEDYTDKINNKIKSLIGENQYVKEEKRKELFIKWDISKDVEEKINDIINKDSIFKYFIKYENSLKLLCEFLKYTNDEYDLDIFIEYLLDKNNINFFEQMTLMIFAIKLMNEKTIIFTLDDVEKMNDINYDMIKKLLETDFFIKRDRWYQFANPLIQLYFVLYNYINGKDFYIYSMVKALDEYSVLWEKSNDFYWDRLDNYYILKHYFREKWERDIELEVFKMLIDRIDTTNEKTISISLLKNLHLAFDFENNLIRRSEFAILFNDLLVMLFDIDLIDSLFIVFEIEEFYDYPSFIEVNKYINQKRFINLLDKAGLIKLANEVYQKIVNYINK